MWVFRSYSFLYICIYDIWKFENEYYYVETSQIIREMFQLCKNRRVWIFLTELKNLIFLFPRIFSSSYIGLLLNDAFNERILLFSKMVIYPWKHIACTVFDWAHRILICVKVITREPKDFCRILQSIKIHSFSKSLQFQRYRHEFLFHPQP